MVHVCRHEIHLPSSQPAFFSPFLPSSSPVPPPPCSSLPRLVRFRWLVPAGGDTKLRLLFSSQDEGQFDQTLGFEIAGTRRRYQLFCRGLCVVPTICREPRWVCSFPHNVGYFDWWLSCVQDRVYFSKEDHQKGRNSSEEVCPQRGDVCLWTPALWKDQRKVGRDQTAQVSCGQADVRCSGPMPRFFSAGIVRVATLRTRKC